jgi:hypothetical protein
LVQLSNQLKKALIEVADLALQILMGLFQSDNLCIPAVFDLTQGFFRASEAIPGHFQHLDCQHGQGGIAFPQQPFISGGEDAIAGGGWKTGVCLGVGVRLGLSHQAENLIQNLTDDERIYLAGGGGVGAQGLQKGITVAIGIVTQVEGQIMSEGSDQLLGGQAVVTPLVFQPGGDLGSESVVGGGVVGIPTLEQKLSQAVSGGI